MQEDALKREVLQLREQAKDQDTNLAINKEIIKNLLENNSNPAGANQTLQQVL